MAVEIEDFLRHEDIAEEASLPLHQALEVRAAARASASLDQPVGEQEDAVFGDFVAGDDPLPEEEVEVSLRSQALVAALSSRPQPGSAASSPCRPSSDVAFTCSVQPRSASSSASDGRSSTASVRSGCAITGRRPADSVSSASATSGSAGPVNSTSISTASVPSRT